MACNTDFAPSERSSEKEIARRHQLLLKSEALALFDAIPIIVVVLDVNRQIVFGNAQFTSLIEGGSIEAALGKRPGEFLHCIHASIRPEGCGTSDFCSQCGAVRAIMQSLDGHKSIQECQIRRIALGREEALDLQVSAEPYTFAGEKFIIYSMIDISHKKRRQALESIFFHDVLNTLGGIRNLLEYIVLEKKSPCMEELQLVLDSSSRLIEDVFAQKQLMAAENDELKPYCQLMNAADVIQRVAMLYQTHEIGKDKHLVIAPASEEALLVSDQKLLARIAGNMVKNALEASEPGETVTLGCERRGGEVVLWAHNPAVMPKSVRLRVFNRSFSTKAQGRGLGTYGMKLLGERYLGGRVWFESSEESGTTFYIALPGGGLETLT